jgi:hypothetical protein
MLNRAALIARPKQPYLDWAMSLDDSGLAPDPKGEQTVYLIPEYWDDDEAWQMLEQIYPSIFEHELHGWCTDEKMWPSPRTFAMFKEWFEIELHSVIEDCVDDAIIDEDD